MRPRKKKNQDLRMEKVKDQIINDPKSYKGKWQSEVFNNENPIHVEIGCGKGTFAIESARQNPDINFVAIEVVDTVILMALEKAKEAELPNLQFILGNANDLTEYFEENEIDRIYINFSDPWRKHYQEHRRLSHKNYLDRYKLVLKNGCEVHQKTDNRPLFDFSIKSFEKEGWKLKNVTFDLHNSDFKGNIVTEYEKKFSDQGFPIHRLEAVLCK